jgi:hypothetical protein
MLTTYVSEAIVIEEHDERYQSSNKWVSITFYSDEFDKLTNLQNYKSQTFMVYTTTQDIVYLVIEGLMKHWNYTKVYGNEAVVADFECREIQMVPFDVTRQAIRMWP